MRFLDHFGQNAHDVGAALVESPHLVVSDIEAGDLKALTAEEQCQRQTDVAHADYANARLPSRKLLFERFQRICGSNHVSIVLPEDFQKQT